MSYLTETATLEFDPSGGVNNNPSYEYHLPHTKTIDLIGEEFAPKARPVSTSVVTVENIGANGIPINAQGMPSNVVLVNSNGSTISTNSSGVPLQVQQILQQAQNQTTVGGNNIVSVALSQAMGAPTPQSFSLTSSPTTLLASSNGSSPAVVIQPNNEYSFQTSPASVTVDLPSIHPQSAASEENGVLLCNLDDLSRYIPENFYSDFTASDTLQVPDYLQTVVAGKAITTTTNSQAVTNPSTQSVNPHPQSITIQLPTQPQPIQGVKTVTCVKPFNANNNTTLSTSTSQVSPGKLTNYAYTPSGERIAIQGLPEATIPGSTLQVRIKGGGMQTLQLCSAIEPGTVPSAASKLTVFQELPEVGKVVIQDSKPLGTDSINEILEGMKQDDGSSINVSTDGMAEYATAIPVAVTSLASDPKKTTIKRVAAPASTVFLPQNAVSGSNNGKQSRIIFAGNTLPQGAIPIQINGLNAIPITAVKSIPFTLNTLTNSTPANNSSVISSSPAIQNASPIKKVTKTLQKTTPNKVNNSGNSSASNLTGGSFPKIQSTNLANINKAIGNNKTCNWVFENGEVCGKTFSKSYNLVVHMRMHEDVRPFGCSLCDQTFRQKAHLQRHETTHGIGVKITNRSGGSSGAPRRKRKRSSRGSTGSASGMAPLTNSPPPSSQMSANLQQRLARVSEQFGTIKEGDLKDEIDDSPEAKHRRLDDSLINDDSVGGSHDPNAAFQPYIATAEEVAAVGEDSVGRPRTSPHLDAAVTAAVNEAISEINEAMM